MGADDGLGEEARNDCVGLRRACVFLTGAGAGAGAVQSVPVAGTLPASSGASFVQRRSSVAPAAQAGLEAVFKLLADKVEGNRVNAGI